MAIGAATLLGRRWRERTDRQGDCKKSKNTASTHARSIVLRSSRMFPGHA
jgi:hypothetical protein